MDITLTTRIRARARRSGRRRRDMARGVDRVARVGRGARVRGGGETHQGVGGKARRVVLTARERAAKRSEERTLFF